MKTGIPVRFVILHYFFNMNSEYSKYVIDKVTDIFGYVYISACFTVVKWKRGF
jgi:hypothetical protein